MTAWNHYKDIEEKMRRAAGLLPGPSKPLPLSSVMEQRRQSENKRFLHGLRSPLWRWPVWRIAVFALIVFAACGTAVFAASPKLRTAIARIFSSGVTETVPIHEIESEESLPATDSSEVTGDVSGELSAGGVRQTAGSLTLVRDVTLDAHFTASYASSPDYLTLEETPSGMPIFMTRAEDGETVYYSVTDGNLEEIHLETKTLTAVARLGALPGVMAVHGDNEAYRDLKLPPMEFTVNWRRYGADVLIDDSETGSRFDVGSSYGADLGRDYDGQFSYRALAGQEDVIEVSFSLDAQATSYQYPFLLNLATGEVSDPLALADLSGFACITELSIQDDLNFATAMAGGSHEDLRKITIDLHTGNVTSETDSVQKPPVDDCFTWFAAGKNFLFYVTGTEERGDGCLYNTQTKETTVLFEDAACSYMWGGAVRASRYWQSIGYGYLAYYANDTVFLINLQDGGEMTALKDIPMSQNIDFFMNDKGSVLSVLTHREDSFETVRLCLLDLKTMEAWYFDRNLPESVEENTHYWNGEYGYVMEAEDLENGINYIYLYQYTP